MRKFVFALALVALVGVAAPANADGVWGAPDVAPGATLLLPYFELDLDNPAGVTTLFSVNNASATAILAHVIFWTDWSQHSLDFNIYLTGYDVQTVNIRDVFDGFLPITASAGQDPGDQISNKGIFSQDINFASCNGILPYSEPALPAFNLELINNGHTGKPVTAAPYLGRCVGENYGDNVARGYVTVDTVNNCTLRFPGEPGYIISGGAGDITNQNVLWGDFFIVDAENNFAMGEPMVHIQADALAAVPGDYTFYGRYVAATAADNREPLGAVWAARFLNGGGFDGGTDLMVWRDSTVNNQPVNGFLCASGPSWVPLDQAQIMIFDEEENPVIEQICPISPCPQDPSYVPFPLETQRTQVGGDALPVPYNFGWLYLNLNHGTPPPGQVIFANVGPLASQSWVISSHSAEGRFQVGHVATMLVRADQFYQTFIGN